MQYSQFRGIVSHKREPFLWVLSEYLHDGVSADPSVHHLGYYVLQDVSIAMTSITNLGNTSINNNSNSYNSIQSCALMLSFEML